MTNKEVEKAYMDLISLENETRDFLIYIFGDHPVPERERVFKEGEKTANKLFKRSNNVFPFEIFRDLEKEYIFSDGKTYTGHFLYSEWLRIIRNVKNWLNWIFYSLDYQYDT